MHAVQHQRPPEPPVVQLRLEPAVTGVVAPHEPDLRQPPPQPGLRLQHTQRPGRVRHHGLLAQHRQPAGEGREQRLLVRGAGRGDQYGLDAGRVERGLGLRVDRHPLDPGHGLLRARGIGIGHGGDPGSADHAIEAAYVVGSHVSGTQHGHAQQVTHAYSPSRWTITP